MDGTSEHGAGLREAQAAAGWGPAVPGNGDCCCRSIGPSVLLGCVMVACRGGKWPKILN